MIDLREEEEESSEDEMMPQINKATVPAAVATAPQKAESAPDAVADPELEDQAREASVEALLRNIRQGQIPPDSSQPSMSDTELNAMSHKDFPELRRARAKLTVKAKDQKIDVIFRARIAAMAGTLNLYLDPELSYTWRQASLIAAKSHGKGINNARNIRTWIHSFLHRGKYPFHHYGRSSTSILHDEDLAQEIQLHLLECAKDGYIKAQDVVDYISKPEVQERLGASGNKKTTISLRTAQRWMRKNDWRYGKKRNGMYIDGHEREDVVKYRGEFIERWKEYEKRMVTYDNEGDIAATPSGFPVAQGGRFRLILVTHDESTFYAHDRRKTQWNHSSDKATPVCKGEGPSLMISDMLTLDWGCLRDDEE